MGKTRPGDSVRNMFAALVLICISHGDADEHPATTEKPNIQLQRNATYAVYTADADSDSAAIAMKADVYSPADAGPHPGLLLIHGGGWTTGSKLQMAAHARRMAIAGFVAASIDYRLAPRHRFPAQIEDCWRAYAWMIDNAEQLRVDASNIAVVGYSAGGHLACLMGTTEPSEWGVEGKLPKPRAIVAGGAPCNFEILPPDKSILAHWLGGTRNEVPHVYRQASPVRAVTPDDPPTFFYHGSDDTVVPSHVSRQMADKLATAGVPVEYYLCTDKGHVSTFFDVEAGQRATAFLNRFMNREPETDQQALAK